MKNTAACVLVLLAVAYQAISQTTLTKGSKYCSEKSRRPSFRPIFKEGVVGAEHAFDVLSYKLSLDISACFEPPYPHSYKADETITALADSSLDSITLDAIRSSLAIDSVSQAGRSFVQSASTVSIRLDRRYNPGDTIMLGIAFRHLDVSDNAFYAGDGMVFTDCEPEGARSWFPCWDKPSDKATWDLNAIVAPNVRLGSNGRLADSTFSKVAPMYHWVSRDPIATYLMVISAKVGYNLDIVEWPRLSNPSERIPIRFYWNTGENTTNLHHIEDIILPMTTEYSLLFGEHPFEKNGFATLNGLFGWAGMENQTLTSLCPDCWDEGLVSHEFAHQWFGDMITCGTWADIWLNEGFATYCEDLWLEHQGGQYAYTSGIANDAASYYYGNPGWPIVNPSWESFTPSNDVLFNYAITYAKGACVLHMLRYTLGDSLFFAAMKAYATDPSLKFKSARTADFTARVSEIAGQDLSWFFNEWLFQPDHPVYQNSYSFRSAGAGQWNVIFTPRQTQTNTVFFTMPVELKISFADAPDSIVRVMNSSPNDQFTFSFSHQPTALQFDPNNGIPLKDGTTSLVTSVSEGRTELLEFGLGQNYPNPFNPRTVISSQLPVASHVQLVVYDVLGREVATLVNERRAAGRYRDTFDGAGFPSGVYYCRLTAGNFVETKKMLLIK